MPERPPQPGHQRLERTGGVGGRFAVPHLADQHGRRDGPSDAQRQYGEESTQPRPAESDGRAVGAERLGRGEDPVAHGPIVRYSAHLSRPVFPARPAHRSHACPDRARRPRPPRG